MDGQRVTDDAVMRVVETAVAEANAALCAELEAPGRRLPADAGRVDGGAVG